MKTAAHQSRKLVCLLILGLFWRCSSVPPQPRSALTYRPVQHVEWIWAGALTGRSATVKAKLAPGKSKVRLWLSTSETFQDPVLVEPFGFDPGSRVVTFHLSRLQEDSTYHYAVESEGKIDGVRRGHLKTPRAGHYSYQIAFGTCARTGSSGRVWDTIRKHQPLMLFHLGDFHYQSLGVNDVAAHRAAFDHVLASPAQSLLFRMTPILYVWDDHDFGPDDCDSSNPGRLAAGQVYREYVPHYPFAVADLDVAVPQSFTLGRVRFIVTDLRAERTPHDPNRSEKTMMGPEQKAWFKEELLQAGQRFPLVVWISTVPWIEPSAAGSDGWGGYWTERRELAGFIHDHLEGRIAMIGGDAHMIAADDGSNSNYSTSGGAGFPVFHAGAFDQAGSAKGGPYSHGAFPGGGQFGLMTVEDEGPEIHVRWSGRDWRDRELVSLSFSVPSLR